MKKYLIPAVMAGMALAAYCLPSRQISMRDEMFAGYQRLEWDANANIRNQFGVDPWGMPLRLTKTTYWSAGPDCQFGTWDDIRGHYNPDRTPESN